jgi:hypothetical protein
VPLDLKGKNRALVGLGSYIVNAQGGCNDCHTNPPYADGGSPFEGQQKQINTTHYLAGGMSFGPVTSTNITPDDAGLPAGLTFKQFKRLIRTGFDESEGRLLQVMPWPVYQDMTTRDLKAIYEYLRAIPHTEPGPLKAASATALVGCREENFQGYIRFDDGSEGYTGQITLYYRIVPAGTNTGNKANIIVDDFGQSPRRHVNLDDKGIQDSNWHYLSGPYQRNHGRFVVKFIFDRRFATDPECVVDSHL